MPALLFILLPLVEIVGFIVVGQWIGVLPTIGLVIATSLLGAVLLRVQGFGILARMRAETEAGRLPGREVANGMVVLLAALLLFLPGFFTDLIGLLLFIPPLRAAVWRFFGRRMTIVGSGFARRGAAGSRTIDLDPDDFQRSPDETSGSPDPNSPWRRIGDG